MGVRVALDGAVETCGEEAALAGGGAQRGDGHHLRRRAAVHDAVHVRRHLRAAGGDLRRLMTTVGIESDSVSASFAPCARHAGQWQRRHNVVGAQHVVF